MKPDFSGFVTKADLECTDGRVIDANAFAHHDGTTVPLLYMHNHKQNDQLLGHVKLTQKNDGVWGDVYLNDTPNAKLAKTQVFHGDIDKFSVWAKDLVERGNRVLKGKIQEVSLVLQGANPGATIQNVLMHDDFDEDQIVFVGNSDLQHADGDEEDDAPSDEGSKTIDEVLGSLTEEQTDAINSVINTIVDEAVTEALADQEDSLQHNDQGDKMSRNLFENKDEKNKPSKELTHDDIASVFNAAKANGGVSSLKALSHELLHADEFGIENIEILFPDAKDIQARPTFIDRRQEWVKTFLNGTSHTPFSRIRTTYADITADEARAKGYIKGKKKIEEFFPVFRRTTGPAMIYKKQKLNRQDIIDITDFDIVAFLKVEMRGKLDEEIARAALFGDGREITDEDKIQAPTGPSGDGIRVIVDDDDIYTTTFSVPLPVAAAGTDWNAFIDAVTLNREGYLGSGNLTAFMPYSLVAKLLTIRDEFGHRVYKTVQELAGDMDVQNIVRVPTDLFTDNRLAVILDLRDYNFGTNSGGEITLFDDFDIDFNQYKYLMETYLSGALVLPYSAQVYVRVDAATATKAAPVKPAIAANVITIPTTTGVVYKRTDTGATVAGGSTVTLDSTTLSEVKIESFPASGYYFDTNDDRVDAWTFKYKA